MIKKMIGVLSVAVISIGLLGGCADQQARDMAMNAQATADSAQACCNANSERFDRMYQKIMGK